jgi:D-apionolactonase
MNRNLFAYGSENELPNARLLRAGKLTMLYENGFLRYISCGEIEIIRLINLTVRNQHWGTVPMQIKEEEIVESENSFSISYSAGCLEDEIDFFWRCKIFGTPGGEIEFHIFGKANSYFLKNRIGFTVLHPIATSEGKDCLVTHENGIVTKEVFPALISPHQPFTHITAMHWSPDGYMQARLEFEGELFETEDQRNWLDASFKTYCTPQDQPSPVQIREGDEIIQCIKCSVEAVRDTMIDPHLIRQFFVDEKIAIKFPTIGIGLNNMYLEDWQLELLKELDADYFRVSISVVEMPGGDWIDKLAKLIEKLNSRLELVFFTDAEIPELVLQNLGLLTKYIDSFVVLPVTDNCTSAALIALVKNGIKKYFPNALFGAGTDAFFTQLNRERTPVKELDFLCFSANPQVHATDQRTVTENLATLQHQVQSCKIFAQGKAVHAGPVSFKMRWNPDEPGSRQRDPLSDLRQLSCYGAVFTLGSFKYLAAAGAAAVNYFEATGCGGLMNNENAPWPQNYGVPEQFIYPLYFVLKELLQRKNQQLLALETSDPLLFDGICFVNSDQQKTIFLFNYTAQTIPIEMPKNTVGASYQLLNQQTMFALGTKSAALNKLGLLAISEVLQLPPFAIAILHCGDRSPDKLIF